MATTRMRFEEAMTALQAEIMEMAGLTEALLGDAVEAVRRRKVESLAPFRERDAAVDALEARIDEQVMELLALHHPVASDLRFLLTTLKIANDLERVGDHAVHVARAVRKMEEFPPLPDLPELREMGDLTQRMLADTLEAYTARDEGRAGSIRDRDEQVDALRRSLFRILVTHMFENPRTISPALEAIRASQNLERIADLATNIAEEAVFLVTGESHRSSPARDFDQENP